MTISGNCTMEHHSSEGAVSILNVPIDVDLEDVVLLHPDPDGGTALYVRGAGWTWIDVDHALVREKWLASKALGAQMPGTAAKGARC